MRCDDRQGQTYTRGSDPPDPLSIAMHESALPKKSSPMRSRARIAALALCWGIPASVEKRTSSVGVTPSLLACVCMFVCFCLFVCLLRGIWRQVEGCEVGVVGSPDEVRRTTVMHRYVRQEEFLDNLRDNEPLESLTDHQQTKKRRDGWP